ncbi:hypothetical protein GIB67_025423 [Kingdonia uniflora]|uniref:Uncharacterized protein n=1 Tax=Kingdonia uniflora TaxID=39325 RepID=A0A7J7LJM5_9MAGN|nr:hypothetical protein GIB67_025423 [Kingdonia uniflora]
MLCQHYLQILFLSFKIHVLLASNAISTGQSLTGNQTITSEGGIFELGFFKPGKSLNYYLGIWYKQIPVQTVVWVANRDNPVFNTFAVLKLSEDGNLVLLNELKIPVWSTNTSSSSSSSKVALFLGTGNFVLRDGPNSSTSIWQSFEHPTDTWLPHGRIGMSKITGEFQVLSPWKNLEDPSPGKYTVEVDPDGSSRYHLVWSKSQIYWTRRFWNGKTFANAPDMAKENLNKFDYVSNEKENYFTYTAEDSFALSRYVIDASGSIKQFIWLNSSQEWLLIWSRPSDLCDAYSIAVARSSDDRFPEGLRVLVIDDDPTCLLIAKVGLKKFGYNVTTTRDPYVALEFLRNNNMNYDIVITDFHMPQMDGFKLMEIIGLEMNIPVIMMPSSGDKNTIMKGVKHGACDYLMKPIILKEL